MEKWLRFIRPHAGKANSIFYRKKKLKQPMRDEQRTEEEHMQEQLTNDKQPIIKPQMVH